MLALVIQITPKCTTIHHLVSAANATQPSYDPQVLYDGTSWLDCPQNSRFKNAFLSDVGWCNCVKGTFSFHRTFNQFGVMAGLKDALKSCQRVAGFIPKYRLRIFIVHMCHPNPIMRFLLIPAESSRAFLQW